MNDRVENLTDKPITEFEPGDTIYIIKMKNGHQITHLCRFVGFSRGCVEGEVIDFNPDWAYHCVPKPRDFHIRARLSKCYLWGKDREDMHPRCHWFDSKTKKAE